MAALANEFDLKVRFSSFWWTFLWVICAVVSCWGSDRDAVCANLAVAAASSADSVSALSFAVWRLCRSSFSNLFDLCRRRLAMAAEDLDLPTRSAYPAASHRRYASVASHEALEVTNSQRLRPLTRAQRVCEALNMVVRGQSADSCDVPRESTRDRSLFP